jgi:hypothetical protein
LAVFIILILIAAINLLGSYLADVFVSESKERSDALYQGGESITSEIRKYRAENFNLALFFLILHVIGFMGATIYVLATIDHSPLNYVTVGFGIIIFYAVILVRYSRISIIGGIS